MALIERPGEAGRGDDQPAWTSDDSQAEVIEEIDSGGSAAARHRWITDSLAIVPSVSIVLPVKNEADNLPHVFASLPEWADEVVLVDGNSTDDTIAVARRLRPDVRVVAQHGKGKGDALQAGFAASKGDIIVTIDGDGSNDGAEIVHFVSALVAGADFVKGSRFASAGGSEDITFSRRWGNRMLGWLVNMMFRTQYTDLCYGYNAFWSRHLPVLAIECPGFEVEALMNIRAAKAGLKVHEVPSYERPRIHGASKLRAVTDGWRILTVIMRERFGPPLDPAAAGWMQLTGVSYTEVPSDKAAADPDRDCA